MTRIGDRGIDLRYAHSTVPDRYGRIFSLGEGKPGIRFYKRFRVKEPPHVGWNRRALLTLVFFVA